jgi:formate hydrogenlyase subunit 3/multisubunit Na+/H+ antiporter MnhD subunit
MAPEALATSAPPSYLLDMDTNRQTAMAEFKRIIAIIAIIAVLMVVGALTYLGRYTTLDANTVVATALGVFFSTLLGCGLFAAAFFSDKSGHDQDVTDASKSERERR